MTGVRVPYPAWTMGVAAILATSSLVPIICGLVRANHSDKIFQGDLIGDIK